jgi:hypothetical protein
MVLQVLVLILNIHAGEVAEETRVRKPIVVLQVLGLDEFAIENLQLGRVAKVIGRFPGPGGQDQVIRNVLAGIFDHVVFGVLPRIIAGNIEPLRVILVALEVLGTRLSIPYLHEYYEKLKARRGTGKAIIATARKLLGIIYTGKESNAMAVRIFIVSWKTIPKVVAERFLIKRHDREAQVLVLAQRTAGI